MVFYCSLNIGVGRIEIILEGKPIEKYKLSQIEEYIEESFNIKNPIITNYKFLCKIK